MNDEDVLKEYKKLNPPQYPKEVVYNALKKMIERMIEIQNQPYKEGNYDNLES